MSSPKSSSTSPSKSVRFALGGNDTGKGDGKGSAHSHAPGDFRVEGKGKDKDKLNLNPAKRKRDGNGPSDMPALKREKKSGKKDRPNEDELDDIDDWNKEEDGDDYNDGSQGEDELLSERELLNVKRQRRLKKGGDIIDDEHDRTRIDANTSLATEGIPIEPFHMQQEESDGTGYFDGDTYVFRKSISTEEPDAWLDELDDSAIDSTYEPRNSEKLRRTRNRSTDIKQQRGESADKWTKEQLYSKILPLVSDTETVSQAVRRYGLLLKRKRSVGTKNGGKDTNGTTTSLSDAQTMAKTCLDDLTGAANALLLQGEVNIYDTTRLDMLKVLPAEETANKSGPANYSARKEPTEWEYMGNMDGQLHGPFTTEQMISWTSAGYFVGDQKVKIRPVRMNEKEEEEKEKTKSTLTTKEEMLADLMDDDDDDEDELDPKDSTVDQQSKNVSNAKKAATATGEWMWSNQVEFSNYLQPK